MEPQIIDEIIAFFEEVCRSHNCSGPASPPDYCIPVIDDDERQRLVAILAEFSSVSAGHKN